MELADTIEFFTNCILVDRSVELPPFCGGNSTKATSGIYGSETRTQKDKDIADTIEISTNDSLKGGAKTAEVVKVF